MPEPIPTEGSSGAEFGARTPWTAGAAAVFGVLTVATSMWIASLAQPLHAGLGTWLARGRTTPGAELGQPYNMVITLLVVQAVIIAMVWWGAARFGGERRRVLSLDRKLTLSAFLWGLAGMIALLAPYNIVMFTLWPGVFAADMRPFWDLARSPALGLAAVAVAAGAPLAEELLFRGFLLPALCKTRHGFIGAAVIASLGWTALHFYSIAGLIEVLLIGLYFSWLMWRHNNLLLPLSLHALYNGGQLAALALWPGT